MLKCWNVVILGPLHGATLGAILGLLLGASLGTLVDCSGAVAGCDSGDVSGSVAWNVAGSTDWLSCRNGFVGGVSCNACVPLLNNHRPSDSVSHIKMQQRTRVIHCL